MALNFKVKFWSSVKSLNPLLKDMVLNLSLCLSSFLSLKLFRHQFFICINAETNDLHQGVIGRIRRKHIKDWQPVVSKGHESTVISNNISKNDILLTTPSQQDAHPSQGSPLGKRAEDHKYQMPRRSALALVRGSDYFCSSLPFLHHLSRITTNPFKV